MKVLITGDSHTAALQLGKQAIEAWPAGLSMLVRPLGGGHMTREAFFLDRGDYAEIVTPEYKRQFERLPLASDKGDLIYGISAPLHSVRVWRHPDWSRYAPTGFGTGASSVSSGLVRRIILDDQRYVLELIAILLRAGRRVFVIEPPRPFRHHPALRDVSADLVLHLDTTYRKLIRCELEAMDVPVLSIPPHWINGGFMREEYAKPGDPHHGNALYGRQMMDEILGFLGGLDDGSGIGQAVAADTAPSLQVERDQ